MAFILDLTKVRRIGIIPAALVGGLFSFAAAAWAQTNACDLNTDGAINVIDYQAIVNMSLGLAPCTADIVGTDTCNVVATQRVINAALGGQCTPHSVTLTWVASTSSGVVGYNVHRGTASGGPYTLMTSTRVAGITYTDSTVMGGQTYYYVVTAVDGNNNSSTSSNQATAAVPSP